MHPNTGPDCEIPRTRRSFSRRLIYALLALLLHFSDCGIVGMGNSFRQQPGPTLYGENKTPVTEDVLEIGLVVAFAMIAFSFILIIPGIRGWEVRSYNA